MIAGHRYDAEAGVRDRIIVSEVMAHRAARPGRALRALGGVRGFELAEGELRTSEDLLNEIEARLRILAVDHHIADCSDAPVVDLGHHSPQFDENSSERPARVFDRLFKESTRRIGVTHLPRILPFVRE